MTERIKVFVCANDETLADGIIEDRQFYADSITDAVGDVCRWLDDQGYDSKCASRFRDWHGGRFDHGNNRIGMKLGNDVYGYRNGWVVTLEKNPSAELTAVVDKASDMLSDKLYAVGTLEDADKADAIKAAELAELDE